MLDVQVDHKVRGKAELGEEGSWKQLLHITTRKSLPFRRTGTGDVCNIVGWNRAAAYVFLDFDRIPPEERNMIRLLFTRREFQRLAVNWEQFASGFLSMFRSYYGQYVEDEWYDRFLEEMKNGHPDFNRMWEQSQVSYAPEVHLEFRHAKAGKMVYELTSLKVYGTDARQGGWGYGERDYHRRHDTLQWTRRIGSRGGQVLKCHPVV